MPASKTSSSTTTETESTKVVRTLTGTVVSDVNEKTIVVAVHSMKTHPKYRKRYGSTVRYQVHDPQNAASVGDTVQFRACRPLSKTKRWVLVPSSVDAN